MADFKMHIGSSGTEEIFTIRPAYQNLSAQKKMELLNLLGEWVEDELEKLEGLGDADEDGEVEEDWLGDDGEDDGE